MTDSSAKSDWQTKDVFLSLPFVASTLAISWEVGRMIPFGGFHFFSLTEHLLSAVKALPLALMTSVFLAMLVGLYGFIGDRFRPEKPLRPFLLGVLGIAIALGGSAWFQGTAISLFILEGLILLLLANAFWFRFPLTSLVSMLVLFGIVIALTMSLANEQSVILLKNSRTDPRALSTVNYKDGSQRAGLLVMSGERGLLIYDPKSDTVKFERPEDIKSVEWPR